MYGLIYSQLHRLPRVEMESASRAACCCASPEKGPDGKPANTRIDQTSADGRDSGRLDGGSAAGTWDGVVWNSGVPSQVFTANGEPVDEISAVSGDGTVIGGATLSNYVNGLDYPQHGFRRRCPGDGPCSSCSRFRAMPTRRDPRRCRRDGSVMVGFSGSPWFSLNPGPFIWTRQMGTMNLDEFVRGQGTAMEQWDSLWEPTRHLRRRPHHRRLGHTAFSVPQDGCSRSIRRSCAITPAGKSQPGQTLSVAFPQEFDQHLAQGDAVGRCQ